MSESARPYVALLLFGFASPAPGHRPLFREDVTLLHATSREDAEALAAEHGRSQENTYRNEVGEEITLRLLQVVDVVESLDDDLTGTADLYSRHFTDLASYRAFDPMLDGAPL